jgi:squalene-hopene/tetraprenyl-beta-curcumene cyclase
MKLAFIILSITSVAFAGGPGNWDAKRAAGYLDQRAGWWMDWPNAARDHDTFCVSCHTALPYALARPMLRSALAEHTFSPNEQRLLENVKRRVGLWAEAEPFYSDEKNGAPKSAEARGTESVLNAIILTSYDAPSGKLSDLAKTALSNMWAMQWKIGETRGAWSWLNFHNEPWEADDSQFWGATLAAIAVGRTPAEYRAAPEVQQNIALLIGYLRRMQSEQSLLNRTALLWASAKLPGLLEPKERDAIVKELGSTQQAGGGWSAGSLVMKNWKRRDDTPFDTSADGYATGLVLYALQQVGVADASVQRGMEWLVKNQNQETGSWTANSLNGKKDLSSDRGKFLSDAATAYAVLALTIPQ